jgi:hypothetical protein
VQLVLNLIKSATKTWACVSRPDLAGALKLAHLGSMGAGYDELVTPAIFLSLNDKRSPPTSQDVFHELVMSPLPFGKGFRDDTADVS